MLQIWGGLDIGNQTGMWDIKFPMSPPSNIWHESQDFEESRNQGQITQWIIRNTQTKMICEGQ